MITVGIASIPSRFNLLKKTLDSLTHQVDIMYVCLNGYEYVPEYFHKYDNIDYSFSDNSKGDAMKFAYADKVYGYYLTCDDDLVYPSDYVSYMVDRCRHYGCPVSLAGKNFQYPVHSYHRSAVDFYHCLRDVEKDHVVQVVGTGVLCFNTKDIKVTLDAFEKPNMADLWFAKMAKEQKIQLMVLNHRAGYLTYTHPRWTIWGNKERDGAEMRLINEILRMP